jgi:hypothetical protein
VIVLDQDAVKAFVTAKIGHDLWGPSMAFGWERDGNIIAGVIVNNYEKDARCSINCAGEGVNWLNREFLFVVFDYVFNYLHCNVVVNWIDARNLKSIRLTEHIGFKVQTVIQMGCKDSDLVVLTYSKADCKWIHNAKYIRKYHAARRPLDDRTTASSIPAQG